MHVARFRPSRMARCLGSRGRAPRAVQPFRVRWAVESKRMALERSVEGQAHRYLFSFSLRVQLWRCPKQPAADAAADEESLEDGRWPLAPATSPLLCSLTTAPAGRSRSPLHREPFVRASLASPTFVALYVHRKYSIPNNRREHSAIIAALNSNGPLNRHRY